VKLERMREPDRKLFLDYESDRKLDENKHIAVPPMIQELKELAPEKRRTAFIEQLKQAVAEETDQAVLLTDDRIGFFEAGVDSLTAIRIKDALSTHLGLTLSSTLIFDYPNLNLLTEFLAKKISSGYDLAGLTLESEKPGATEIQSKDWEGEPVNIAEPIAIIGMGCRFPGGANHPDLYWELLKNGRDAMIKIPPERWDIDKYYDPNPDALGKTYTRMGGFVTDVNPKTFDANFFKVSPKEAKSLDPQQRMLLEVSWEAFENAGIPIPTLSGKRVGVYLGICTDDYKGAHLWASDFDKIDAYSASGSMYCSAGGRLSYVFGFQGPNCSVDTACSSSLVALHLACQALKSRDAEIGLVAGVNGLFTPNLYVYFSKLGALSPDGHSKSFDASANGYARGEGCGAVVLKRLSDAQRDNDRILAVIRGVAINQDGASSSFTAPNGSAQQEVMRLALRRSGVQPRDVGYIEAHGTGTALGDPVEAHALGQVYGAGRSPEDPLIIGSVKANIGHLEGAAGIAGLIKIALMLNQEAIPPQIHFHTPNPLISWDELPIAVPTRQTDWNRSDTPRRAGLSSFGFSGTNAHVIIEEPPLDPNNNKNAADRPVHILPISAKNRNGLNELVEKYRDFFDRIEARQTHDQGQAILPHICHTASAGRVHFDHRTAFTGRSIEEFRRGFSSYSDDNNNNIKDLDAQKIVFLCTGQGSQYPGMGQMLYKTQPVFRQAMDHCGGLFDRYLDRSIIQLIYAPICAKDNSEKLINQTRYTQPGIFAIEYALAKLWQSWGAHPSALAGHSIGEYVAACLADVFSLEDAVKLVSERGRLMQSLPAGGLMAAIFADETVALDAIAGYDDVSIAAVNAPTGIVVSGAGESIRKIVESLKSKKIKSRQLVVSHAFHSPLMEPILEQFHRVAEEVAYHAPKLPVISNLTGKFATEKELTSADYWTDHIRGAVRFNDSMQTLNHDGYRIFLEVGAHSTLTSLGKQCLPDSDPHVSRLWLNSLKRKQLDWEMMTGSLARLYEHGADIDWKGFDAGVKRRKVSIPLYPFQRREFWMNPVADEVKESSPREQDGHPLIGRQIVSPALKDTILFQTFFNSQKPDFLREHIIYDRIISPAAAHLSMLQSAAKLIHKTDSCILENIHLDSPLAIHPKSEREVQLIIHRGSENGADFDLISQDMEYSETHCTGSIRLFRDPVPDRFEERPDKVKDRCPVEVTGKEFYTEFKASGYDVGPSFQRIAHGWKGDHEALAKLTIDSKDENSSNFISPGLIDSILQTMMLARSDESDRPVARDRVYVPFHFDKVEFFRTNMTPTIRTRARIRPASDNGFIHADISVWDEAEKPLMRITGFTVKETDRRALYRKMRQGALNRSLYRIKWHESPPLSDSIAPDATYLIFADKEEKFSLSNYVIESLKKNKNQYVQVTRGECFERIDGNSISINPFNIEDYTQLLRIFSDSNNKNAEDIHLLYLWGRNPLPDSANRLQVSFKRSAGCLLNLVQSAASLSWSNPPRVWVITRHGQQVFDQEPVTPIQTALWGFGQTISLEHPELWGGLIDVDDFIDKQEISDQILAETASQTEDEQSAFRGGKRYTPKLERILPTDRTGDKKKIVDSNGSYLITGGMGYLGFLFAKRLAELGARYVILMGRSKSSPRVAEEIESLRRDGVEVKIERVDVSDKKALADMFSRIRQEAPQLKGVLHAAGSLDDGMLIRQDWDRFENALSAKAYGAWYLHELTKDLSLDFFALFSSAVSFLGNRGQSNYAAANSFLDGLAVHRRQQGLPGVSIDWGAWAQAGMAVSDEAVRVQLANQGFQSIDPEDGLALFESLIMGDLPRVAIPACDWQRYVDQLPAEKKIGLFSQLATRLDTKTPIEKLPKGNAKQKDKPELLRRLDQAQPNEIRRITVDFLIEKARETIGIDPSEKIDPDRQFIDLGADSLMAVDMRNQLTKGIGAVVPVSALFNYPTVNDLSDYLMEEILMIKKGDNTHENPSVKSEFVEKEKNEFDYIDDLDEKELLDMIEKDLK